MEKIITKNLLPGRSYRVRATGVDSTGKTITSQVYILKTKGKTDAPPNVTNLSADFKGNTLVVTWNGNAARAQKDFKHFRIKLTSINHSGIEKNYYTDSDVFKFQEDQNRDVFGGFEGSISITVYSIDRTGNQSSGVSISIVAPTLDPVINLQGKWDGRYVTASWEYPNPPSNFRAFDVEISNLDETITYNLSTINKEISINKNSFLGVFTSGLPSSLKITVIVRNQVSASSLPTTITIQETVLPTPTNATLTAVPLGYKVAWDAIDDLAYQTTRIYEADSENGTYVFIYTSSTSPVFVPSVNFTPRFVKIAHVNFNDSDSPLAATTPKSVIPINPNQIDITPPGAVTNASAVFDGTTYKLTFDKPVDTDVKDFIITLVGTSAGGSKTRSYVLPVLTTTQQLFQLTVEENINFFGYFRNNIVASIQARDLTSNIGPAVENIAASLDDTPPMPTNVVCTPGILSYSVAWDDPTYGSYFTSKVYESSTETGTYTLASSGKTPLIIYTNSSDSRWVKVSHVSLSGTESEKSAPILVTPINPVSVDTTPPDQRTGISYTALIESVEVNWTNPSGTNNDDLGGITIRYAKTSEPTNYTWVDIPFNSSSLITSAKILNLLPKTSYNFSISTFDKTQNRTTYSTTTSVITLSDSTPPPRPISPSVSAGASASGPMTVRVIQDSIQHGTTTPLPLDTSYFKIFMLNAGQTSAPAPGIATNLNASEVGSLDAGFNGSSNQTLLFIPLQLNEQRYFYTRAVDTSGNISDASVSVQSSVMSVFDSAYIKELSADKIITGTLQASQSIKIGTTSNQITIISESGGAGKIYSGTGSYNSSNTGFYVDSSGQFSLKDRLAFDGTDLSISGNITATGGLFTGNVRLSSGSLYAGTLPSGQRLVLDSSGIAGWDSNNSNKFTLTTEGRLTAKLGTIGGWTISDTTLSSNQITIDSTNKRIKFGVTNPLLIGQDVGGTDAHGIYIDPTNYIYGTGNFSLANGNITWNTATQLLSITGSGSFTGSITAASGNITGPLSIGSNGYILLGANANVGTPRIQINNNSIAGYASNGLVPPGDLTEFILTTVPGGSSIAGWSITSNALLKTSGAATIKLDAQNGQITAGSSSNTVGIKSQSLANSIAIWAGTENPTTSSPFYITNTGNVYASSFNGFGIKLSGGSVLYPVGGRGNINYSVLSLDGKDILMGSSSAGTDGPAKIRWLDGTDVQRATIGWELETNLSDSNYPRTFVIRAIGSSGTSTTSGVMLINASGTAGTIDLKAAGGVTINGEAIVTPNAVINRYRNLTESTQGKTNNITYSNGDPVTSQTVTINGDLHFKY